MCICKIIYTLYLYILSFYTITLTYLPYTALPTYTGRCHATASGYVGPWTPTPTSFNNLYFVLLKSK